MMVKSPKSWLRVSVSFLALATLITTVALALLQPPRVKADGANSGARYGDWRMSGPTGGDVRALVVDPNDPSRFYFGTLDGQIYTSIDGGANWRMLVNFHRPRLFVDHIIVDPRDSRVLYVATHRHKDPGGFFKSTDGGRTWHESAELRNEALHSLTQSEADPDILITGTFNGIFRSTDAGNTWEELPTSSTPGLVHVESLAIDPRNPEVIYAGTWYLPYKSMDGGRTWKVIKTGIIDDSDVFAINIDPRNPNHVIASACSGIYDSRDAGGNWRKVQGIPSQSRRTRAILQHPSIPGLVLAGTTEGFWRSTKGGENNSWMVTTSRQLEINSIAVHPRNPDTIYIGTNNYGVMVSTDGGRNFVPSNGGYSGRFVNAILADREVPNRIYATTINTTLGGGFFFVSEDGGMSWQPSTRNMAPRLVSYSILQDDHDGNILYLGTNLGVYRSMDRGVSWAPVSAPRPVLPINKKPAARSSGRQRPSTSRVTSQRTRGASRPNTQAATQPGERPRSVEALSNSPQPTSPQQTGRETVRRAQEALERAGYEVGSNDGQLGPRTIAAIKRFQSDRYLPTSGELDDETLASLGISDNSSNSMTVVHTASLSEPINALAHFADASGQTGILAATNFGLYRTFDPSRGWDRLVYGAGLDPRTTCISTSNRQPAVIWVGTVGSGVLMSRDGGESWAQIPGVPNNVPVNVIAQDPRRVAFVYVGTKQAFYSSHDGGQHWTRRGGDLPFGDFSSILINSRNSDEIFVGNAYQNGEIGGGVFRSTNAGSTWVRIDSREQGLPSIRIWALSFDSQDENSLLVGSHSAGVYVVPRGGEAASSTVK